MRDWLVEAGLDRLAKWMIRAELYGVEVILCICSLWAATHLLAPGNTFASYSPGFAFMRYVIMRDDYWGFIAAVAVLAKVSGLSLFMLGLAPGPSMALRCVGLMISSFFWTMVGASFLIGNPNSIAGVPLILLGASAWWTLLRFPAVPQLGSP